MRINSIQSYNYFNKPILKNDLNKNNQPFFKGAGDDGLRVFNEYNNEEPPIPGSYLDQLGYDCRDIIGEMSYREILFGLKKSKNPINGQTAGVNDFSESERINLDVLNAKLERLAKQKAELEKLSDESNDL